MPRHKEHTQVCWNKDLTLVWKQSAGNEPQKGVPDFSTERLVFFRNAVSTVSSLRSSESWIRMNRFSHKNHKNHNSLARVVFCHTLSGSDLLVRNSTSWSAWNGTTDCILFDIHIACRIIDISMVLSLHQVFIVPIASSKNCCFTVETSAFVYTYIICVHTGAQCCVICIETKGWV